MQRNRAIIAALGGLALVAAALVLREHGPAGWLPACTFHEITGLHCPGCGLTRDRKSTRLNSSH